MKKTDTRCIDKWYDEQNATKYISISLTQKNQIGLQNRPFCDALETI